MADTEKSAPAKGTKLPEDAKVTGPVVNTPVGPGSMTQEEIRKAHSLTQDEQEAIIGDLEPGELGWVELSPTGEPIGRAHSMDEEVPADKPVIQVYVNPSWVRSIVMTPAGAPLTKNMQPDPALMSNAKSRDDVNNRDYTAIAKRRKELRHGIRQSD